MKYVLSSRAERDLAEIADNIARHNPPAASRLVAALYDRWDLLRDFPYSGAARDDLRRGMRHVVVSRYLTLYKVAGGNIEIVRIMHGRRRIAAHDLRI